MNKLIINTANEDLFMVLKTSTNVYFRHTDSKIKHNEAMIPLLDELLNEANLNISNVNEFGVVVGPGSFTGIRVGISTIKALRDALNGTAKGINNLDFLFKLAHSQNKDILTVAIYGSKNSYFVAKYINGMLYKYERNLTLDELIQVSDGGLIGVFKQNDNLNCFVVKLNVESILECYEESVDNLLVPVYYQLSQAENEKLKNSVVEICAATRNDIDIFSKIESESILTDAITKQQFESMLNNENYKLYTCKLNGVVVGFILVQLTDEICVMSVAVQKENRNFGLATKMFERVFDLAREKQMNVSLEVSEKNLTATLLYQKLGFAARRKRKRYYNDGSDAVEMIKEIN